MDEKRLDDLSTDLEKWGNDYTRLEGRVYTLEKETALCLNILTMGLIVAAYFAWKWWEENMAHATIPGVQG